jgi:hypothetical protein
VGERETLAAFSLGEEKEKRGRVRNVRYFLNLTATFYAAWIRTLWWWWWLVVVGGGDLFLCARRRHHSDAHIPFC